MIRSYISGAGVYRSEAFHKSIKDTTPLRKVTEYEIEFFPDDFKYGLLNNKIIDYKKNTVLIAKPESTRCSKTHFSCYFIHADIHDEALCELINSLPDSISITDESEYLKIFQKISMNFPAEDDMGRLELNGWFTLLISYLIRDSKKSNADIEKMPEIQKSAILSAKAFINLNYHKNIQLSDIAESTHLSPNYFHKLFSSVCGCTPLEHLTKVRIENAKIKLLNTEGSITQIAEECGFNSYNYFCTVFKSRCQMTPKEFRSKGNEYYNI